MHRSLRPFSHRLRHSVFAAAFSTGVILSPALAAEPPGDELLIEEEGGAADELTIDADDAAGELTIDEGDAGEMVIEEGSSEAREAPLERTGQAASPGAVTVTLDKLWAEGGAFTDGNAPADRQGYLNGVATLKWEPAGPWEAQLRARVDAYHQAGDRAFDQARLDYGDSFVRYSRGDYRATLGAQTIIWGRIDELAPTDRISSVDLRRYVLDDLPDRRLAAPVARLERFIGNAKLDLVWLPRFRAAELPDKESVWYPVDRQRGEIIGLESTPLSRLVVRNARIIDDAPDGDGGGGLRFSQSLDAFDYALTVQKVRQSTPYFRYDPIGNALVAEHPRSWVVGGDLGVEAAGATWRFEAAWSSDVPVTAVADGYTTVEGINWGVGAEFYPGDSDTRVNLQLVGNNLLNTPDIVDRNEIYTINGVIDAPFAHQQWRAKLRFFVGLDTQDLYLNPGISFVGWEPHEFYLQAHYFDGSDGTFGGFNQNNSLITLGWRASF